MVVSIVVGMQYGDEGKGKLIDVLSPEYDIIARFQGGNNAGHTIKNEDKRYILHFIPSSILYSNKFGLIGEGVNLNPKDVCTEIIELEKCGIKIHPGNLGISFSTGLILDYHKWLDGFNESKKGEKKIGTTGKGIGPSYTDRTSRCGIRFAEFLDPELFRKLSEEPFNEACNKLNQKNNFEKFLESYNKPREFLKKFAIDALIFLQDSFKEGKSILIEGAQGTCLDVFGGNVPYVTSSNTVAGGTCIGLPIGPRNIDNVSGVMKAYITRVGNGPLITQMKSDLENRIRTKGGEFGATTGRPRSCGWFDVPIMKYAIQKNSLDEIFLTKLDVLSGLKTIKICVSYNNGNFNMPPFYNRKEVDNCKPDYIEVHGWDEDISNITEYKNLPKNAKKYIEELERFGEKPITIVSVGPDRKQTIFRT